MRLRVLALAATAVVFGLPAQAQTHDNWVAPFSPNGEFDSVPPNTIDESGKYPVAASVAILPDGRILYWDGIAGLENRNYPIALDAGANKEKARSRILTLGETGAVFSEDIPTAGDDMFCSDQRMLSDGRVAVFGGNRAVSEPIQTEGTLRPVTEPFGQPAPHGQTDLTGSDDIRIFDSGSDIWSSLDSADTAQTVSHWAPIHDPTARAEEGQYDNDSDLRLYRWYPSAITLPDGRVMVVSGVDRILYNTYGTTIHEAEVYDPSDNSVELLPASADQSLPMYPRLHVLPTGHVFYDGSGSMWGPGGEAVDEALWNIQTAYNPEQQSWTPTGIGNFGAKSGTFSVMLPIVPDADGNYPQSAEILSGGGTLGTAPGTYLGVNLVEKITVGPAPDGLSSTSEIVAPMLNARWFPSSVLLPNGELFVVGGDDLDHVIMPGLERNIREAEIYDPSTNTWRSAGNLSRGRGYHSTAVLLPDGSVLIGGNSPINAMYDAKGHPELDDTGLFANNTKDPSFEIYRPDYMFGDRPATPVVVGQESGNPVLTHESSFDVSADADSFVLVRTPATTHVTDADQRTVELVKSVDDQGTHLEVPNANIVPPGMYYLIAKDDNGVPSRANIVFVR